MTSMSTWFLLAIFWRQNDWQDVRLRCKQTKRIMFCFDFEWRFCFDFEWRKSGKIKDKNGVLYFSRLGQRFSCGSNLHSLLALLFRSCLLWNLEMLMYVWVYIFVVLRFFVFCEKYKPANITENGRNQMEGRRVKRTKLAMASSHYALNLPW